MQKVVLGILIGIALSATVWLIFGRADTTGLRRDLDEAFGVYGTVQSDLSQVLSHSGRIDDLVTAVDNRSLSAHERSFGLIERSAVIEGELITVQDGVESVTDDNKQLIEIGRGIGNEALKLRQIVEGFGEE